MRIIFLWPIITVTSLIIDQITKVAADHSLLLYEPNPLISNINLTLAYNPGAAFSFLGDASGWQRWFFSGLSLLVSGFLIHWLIQLKESNKGLSIALALVLSGAIGNLIDRLVYGHVIDFIDFFYHSSSGCLPLFVNQSITCHWPTFNVADSAISVGAVLLIGLSFFGRQPSQQRT